MKKRILALALTLAMLLSMLPYQVFAAGPVIDGGVHTEHNFEPVTSNPVTQQPDQTQQTPQVEDLSAPVQSQGVPQRGETTGILSLLDYEAAIEDLTELSKNIGIRVAGSANEIKAQDYVAAKFEEMGYKVTRQNFSIPNGTSQNVFGVKKAGVETDLTIYISAHIDTVSPSPGANDDGSGIVAMLAIARAMKDIETKSNIVFVSCGAEEIGLYGSKYFASQLTSEEKANAIGNYNMDMVATSYEDCKYMVIMSASKETVNGIEIYDNHTTRLAQEAARSLGYGEEHFKLLYGVPSDHSSFHNVGIPAVQFYWATDNTSFRLVNGRYPVEPAMHTADDNMEYNFSQERFKLMLDAIALAVYNDATADYVAVVGEGATREYYTDMAEANAAAGAKKVTDLKADMSHEHCVYGEVCPDEEAGQECNHTKVWFESPVDSSNFTSILTTSGHYYLTKNVELASDISFNGGGEIYLCLNGFSITGNRKLSLSGGGKLYLCNCKREAETDGTYHVSNVEVPKGEFWLHSGNLIMNSKSSSTLHVGKFVIDGGNFIADPGTGTQEANVYVQLVGEANVILRSGSIENRGTDGSAVCHAGSGYIVMDGDIALSGGSALADIWLFPAHTYKRPVITIGEGFNPNGKVYTVRQDVKTLAYGETYQLTSGWSNANLDYIPFESTQGCVVKEIDGELYLVGAHYHPLSEGGERVEFQPVTEIPQSLLAGNYYLTGNPIVGNISISADVDLCLAGHTVSVPTYTHRITINSGSTLNICNCQESGGMTAKSNALYLLHNRGTTNIYGGTYTGGTSGTSSRTLLSELGTILNVYDATITGKTGIQTYGSTGIYDCTITSSQYAINMQAGTLTLGGNCVLNGGEADIFLVGGMVITLDPNNPLETKGISIALSDPLGINLNTERKITSGWSTSGLTEIPFEPANDEYYIKEKDGELYLAIHAHDGIVFNTVITQDMLSKPEWNGESSYVTPTPGYYYLTNDLTLPKELRFQGGGTFYICLNGNNILGEKRVTVFNGSKVYICDCKGNGYIHSAYGQNGYVINYGEFHLLGGTFSIKDTTGIQIYGHDGTSPFYLEGGTLLGYANGETAPIYFYVKHNNCSIVLRSGELKNLGSGYCLAHLGAGALVLDGSFKLSGSGDRGDIFLQKLVNYSTPLLTITENFDPKGEVYTVESGDAIPDSGYRITDGWSKVRSKIGYIPFESNQGYAVKEITVNGVTELYLIKAHDHAMFEGGNVVEFKPLTIPAEGITLTTGNYVLTGSTTGALTIPEGNTVQLCLNGQTHNLSGMFDIKSGATLSICDCSTGKTGMIIGNSSPAVKVRGTLNLYSGTIENKSGASGAVAIDTVGNTNLYGGTVRGAAGGVWANSTGTLTIDSEDLTITAGGNAVLVSGVFVLSGSPVIDGDNADIQLNSTCKITLGGKLEPKDGETYSINLGTALSATTPSRVFTTDWSAKGHGAEEIKYFTPVNQTYTIEQEGKELILKGHVHDLPDGSKILYDIALTQKLLDSFDNIDKQFDKLPAGNYLLVEPEILSSGIGLSLRDGVGHICLNGKQMTITTPATYQPSLDVRSGASLRIDDCQKTGTITASWFGSDVYSDTSAAGTLILANGNLEMRSGSSGGLGQGIEVIINGQFIVEGGTLKNASHGTWNLNSISKSIFSGGKIQVPGYAVTVQNGEVILKGSPDIQGGTADFDFADSSHYIHFVEGGTLNMPTEAYTIHHASAPNATTNIRITSGWENSGLASTATTAAKIPFVSTQGYAVREITKDGVKELYLVIPKVEVNYDENMGEAAVTPNGGKEGTEITVTATPLEGYAVDSITMSYWDGTQTVTTTLDTSNVGEDGVVTTTFTMPAADVTVDVTFRELHRHFMAITEDCEDGGVQPNGVNADWVIFSRDLAAALEESNTLTTGSYVLNDDFTYSSDINISGKVDICLQGKILTLDSTSQIRMIVGAGATLRICDCVGTGEVHGKSYQCVEIDDPTGALHLYGGNLHTAGADCVTTEGTVHIMGGAIDSGRNRGINCYQGNSIVHVYGGSVSGYSNGILTYYTEVKVVDGRIECSNGCGIWVGSDTTVEVSGGTIIGKTYGLEMRTNVTMKNTQIILKGDPVIDGETADIFLTTGYKITVGDKFTGKNTYSVAVQTGPTPEAPVQITTEWEEAKLKHIPFTSSQGYYVIEDKTADNKTEVYLIVPEVVTDSDENGTLAMTSPTEANVRVGSTITLKATPNNADYTYGTVTVTYTNDNGDVVTVPVTNKGSGTYTFTMPNAKVVNAYATFKPVHKHYMAADWEFGHEDKGYTHADGTAVGDKAVFATALNQSYFGQNQSVTLGKGYYYLEDDVTLNKIRVSGGMGSGGFTNSNAAYICLAGHTLTLTGGMDNLYETQIIICDCSADKSGKIDVQNSQLVLENGALTLYGGTITGGGTYTVNVKSGNHFKIFGGKVIGNNNTVIYTNQTNASYGQVLIYGGEVCANGTNGKAINSEKATSVLIAGGKITSDGTAVTKSGTGNLTVTGGEIHSANVYAISHGGGAFKLSGAPVLDGETADIYLANGKVITVDGAITGSKYAVLTEQKPENVSPDYRVQITTGWATYGEGITDYPFESADEAYRVKKLSDPVADELYLDAHKHAVSVDCEKNVSGAVKFEELILGPGGIELTDGNYVIPDGHYVLESDVILTGEVGIRIEGNVNLCLNGHSITLDSGYITLPRDNRGTLSICDCIGGGKITSASPAYAVGVNGGCTLNLYGGTIEATVGNGISNYGTLNIYGGSIDGKVNGIYNGATLNLYGSPVINGDQADINLAKDSYINLMCEIAPANGETYSVAVDKTLYTAERHEIRFTQDWTEKGNSNKDYFVGANPAFLVVEKEDGELYLKAHIHVTNEETGEFTLYDKILDNTTISDYYVTRTNIDSVILPEGNYYFNEDIIDPTRVFIVEKPNVNVCLNGCTVNINQPLNGIRLTNGASFIVDECGTNGIGELHSETFYNINGFIDGINGVSHVVLRGGTIYLNGTKYGLVNYSVDGSTITVDGATVILTTLSGHPIFETADNGKYILKSGVIENYRYDFCIDTNYDKVSNSIQLGGDIVINSNVADISLRSGDKITIIDKVEPSDGEPHTIWVHKLPTKDAPVQITTGWENFRTETIPFVSAQGYLVCERTVNNVTELYIVAPTVETDTDENGTLTAAPEYGPVGTLVTLTATPNEGYKYGTVTVTYTDASGNEVTVPVTDNGNGTYTFTMPAVEVVNAYATFKLVHKHAMSVECEETGTVVDFNKELDSNFTGGTLTAGSYVLTDNVLNISKDITISGYVDICLNGKTLDLGSYKIDLNNAVGRLRICDCQGGGTITSSNTTAAINVGKNICQFYLYGGTIESTEAAGVYQPNDGYSHYAFIYGGNIHGKTDGIYSSSYTEINSDVATITADEGYAVRVVNGDFCLAGSSELNGKLADIYLGSGCVIDIDGKVNPEIPYSIDLAQSLSAVDQKIRITTDWTAEGNNSDPSVFYSVDGYEIYLETDGELYVKLHVHTHADGTTIIYNKALTQAVMDQYKGTDQLPEGNYVLLQDITSNTVHFTQDSNLCLFGHKITTTHNDESFYSEEAVSGYGKSASLRIEDCTGEGIIDTATVTSLHRAEITVAGGNINVNGGRLNSGIYTYANGSFIMEGGNITVNNVQYGIGDVQYTGSAYLRGGELTAENFGVLVNMPIYLSGSPKITSGEADFALFTTDNLGTKADDTIIIEGKLIPNGEIYTVFSADELSETLTKIRITTDWEKSGLASVNEGNNGVAVIPFKSTQGYDVVELDYTRADGTVTKELYLVKHQHCVYGANCEDVKAGNACTHGTIWFNQPLDQEMMESFDRSSNDRGTYVHIPSGHYFLASDIDMDFITAGLRFHEEATVYLCLNGHSITNLGEISVIDNAKVYICDCKNDPETGENQGRIDIVNNVWVGLDNSADGGFLSFHGGTINVLDGSYNPLNVWDGGEFVLDGGTYVVNGNGGTTEAIYGYWDYTGRTKGPYPKLTFKSGTIKHTGINYTVAQFGDSYVTLSGTVKIENDNAPADFYLKTEVHEEMTVLTITETFDPKGEIYSVYLEGGLSAKRTKFRITDGWESAGLDHIPFISVQGYMVVEMDYNGHRELYLVKPQADVYLWNGHDVTATGTQLFDAMYSYDPNYLTTIQDWNFTIPEVELETPGLPVGSDGNGITFDAVVGGYGGDAWVTIQQVDEESGAVLKTERLLVTLNIHVYDVKDSVYVLDYVLPVKLNETIFAQDMMPGIGEDVAVKFESYGKTEPVMHDNGLSMTIDVMEDLKGKYGLFTISEDGTEIIYTPDAMLEGKDEAYMIFRAHKIGVETSALGTSDPFKEVEMFKTINILPANVVYYEDTNSALKWNPDDVADITITPVGNEYTGYQDGDNSSEYGSDSAYQYAPEEGYVGGSGGTRKDIVINGAGKILSFTFKGTGFDLMGSTTANSGMLQYKIYSGDTVIMSSPLDTLYNVPGGAIHEAALLHVEGLSHGEYRVEINAVVSYNWGAPKDQWVNNRPPVLTAYLYLDGVRVYNTLSMDDSNREYYISGEATAEFVQIRDMILKGQAAAAKIDDKGLFQFGSGLVSYVETAQKGMSYEGNKVTSLNDYMLVGPNTEVFFNEVSQSLVLYVKETGAEGVVPMLQIGIRNLNPEAFGTGNGKITAPEFVLLGNKGEIVQTLVSGDKAISFTEQYYTVDYTKCVKEDINGDTYYRVVISSTKAAPFSLSNLKFSGLEFYTIPASAATYKYDENGTLIETSNPDVTTMPSLQELAWQLQAANGLLPEDGTEGDSAAELKFRSISLSLQSSIGMNFYVTDETLAEYTDPYVVVKKTCYDDRGEVTTEIKTFELTTAGGADCHVFTYSDIYAKEMSSNVTVTLYATNKDGEVVTGETREYSVVQYAMNMLVKGNIEDDLKKLLVDMVNYGAEAQIYFNYNIENPANAGFEAYQQYASADVDAFVSCSETEGANDYAFKMAGVTLNLADRVEMNFYVMPQPQAARDFTDTKLVVSYFDVTGSTVVKEIPYSAETFVYDETLKAYKVVFDDLNATDMRTPVTAWLADKDDMRISNSKTYSIESYAANVYKQTAEAYEAMRPLVKAMMKYGDAAKAYFGKTVESAQ